MEFIKSLIVMVLFMIESAIKAYSYVGIALLMAIESANVPLPSEAVMPFAGIMVQRGDLNFHLAALAGAVGCVLGSIPSYWLGYVGGRPFLQKYGKWILLTEHDLHTAERWTEKYGDGAFFLCRMLPVVRTFISLPAGILKARFWPFVILTFLGSWIWCYALVYVGVVFGNNMEMFRHLWHQFDAVIILILLVLGGLYVWKHVKHFRSNSEVPSSPVIENLGEKQG